MPGEFQSLADAIYRDRIRRARATPPEERLLDGALLFDFACGQTLAGIRHQHPDWDEAQVRRDLLRRLAIARRLEAMPA